MKNEKLIINNEEYKCYSFDGADSMSAQRDKNKSNENAVGAGPVSAQKNINNTKQHNANAVGAESISAQIKSQHAITLIALIITIVIMLILAGVVLTLTLGEHGIFKTAEEAVVKTEYTAAKEIVDLKLMDIQANCITNEIEYNILEIAKRMKEDEQITIEKYYNSSVALIKNGVNENMVNIKAILVSANNYPKYKFLIGEDCKIQKISTKNVTDTTTLEEDSKQLLEDIEWFETNLGIYTPSPRNIEIFEELEKNGKTVNELAEYGMTVTRVGADQSDYNQLHKLGQGSGRGIHNNTFTLTIDYNTLMSKLIYKKFNGLHVDFYFTAHASYSTVSWVNSKILVQYTDNTEQEIQSETYTVSRSSITDEHVPLEIKFDKNKKVSQIQVIISMRDGDDGGAYGYIKNMQLFI